MEETEVKRRPWWNYLDKVQQDLLLQSLDFIREEEEKPRIYVDYSFVVFPSAKAYEGFLKKLFFDLGLISRTQFAGERFRIGRALNPAIIKDYPQESVYEKLTRYCGGEEISARLWRTWKTSRNLVFHYFPEKENLVSFPEAKERVAQVIDAIDFSFRGCRVPNLSESFKTKTLKNCLTLYGLVFLLWTVYRFTFRYSMAAEELVIKPLLWLLPALVWIKSKEKRSILTSLGYTGKNFENSFWAVLGFVAFFLIEGLIFGYLHFRGTFLEQLFSLPFSSLQKVVVIFITALVEETFFRGYLFNRLWEVLGKSWKANLAVSLGFLVIHLPMSIFVYQLTLPQILLSFLLLTIMSLGSGLLFSLTYNTLPSIIWHFLWNWQVILGI